MAEPQTPIQMPQDLRAIEPDGKLARPISLLIAALVRRINELEERVAALEP